MDSKEKIGFLFGVLVGAMFLPTVFADNHIFTEFFYAPSLMNIALNNSPILGFHNTDGSNGELNIFINNLTLINASNVASQCEDIVDLTVLRRCDNGDISINLTNGTANYNLTYTIHNRSDYNRYEVKTITFNITQKPIFYGKGYNLTVSVVDINGTRTTKTYELKLLRDAIFSSYKALVLDENFNTSLNFKNESKIELTSMKFSSNVTNGSFSIAMYDAPVFSLTNYSLFGKYYNLGLDSNIKSFLQWTIIRLYYNDSDLGELNENLLRLVRINDNGTSEICISPSGGVDTTNNFIYCNTTRFSEWGVGQETISSPEPSQTSSGGSGGGSNTYYYVPISVENKTINKTYVLPVEKLDCYGAVLPEGSICNESGVYIPQPEPEIRFETQYETVIRTVEKIPASIFIGFVILSPLAMLGLIFIIDKIIKFYTGVKK